ncbi:MAG: hypothetical protein VX899_02790 [Myxococcota bacterium]|nr:hypothetical protein [Myxococcota bacterium]
MGEFVFGVPEAVFLAIPIGLILVFIGPKWLRERRAAKQPPQQDE